MSIEYPKGVEFVRCIDAKDVGYLIEDRVYRVLRRYNGEVTVYADRGIRKAYKETRFTPVENLTPAADVHYLFSMVRPKINTLRSILRCNDPQWQNADGNLFGTVNQDR